MIFKKEQPKILQAYFKIKFAFLPVKMYNDDWVWLSFYWVKYRFGSDDFYEVLPYKFLDIEFKEPYYWSAGIGKYWTKYKAVLKADIESPIDNFYNK